MNVSQLVGLGLIVLWSTTARGDNCETHGTVSFDRNEVHGVNLAQDVSCISRERPAEVSHRFIINGRAQGNDLSCDFDVRLEFKCFAEGSIFGQPIGSGTPLTSSAMVRQGHDGGDNQCTYDVNFEYIGTGKYPTPLANRTDRHDRHQSTARVRNKERKLQVIDVCIGPAHCGLR